MTENELELVVLQTLNTQAECKYNPLCIDKKVHVRLQDYDKPKNIAGFENKLEFLTTWLYYSHTDLKVVQNILDNSLVKIIPQYKGSKILMCYKKNKYLNRTYGFIPTSLFKSTSTIKDFLDYFKIESLYEYLFNDNIILKLSKKTHRKDYNKKYINKTKQHEKLTTIDLW